MTDALAPDFDIERLERQQNFIIDRARGHDESTDGKVAWHRACAASLMRDAASVALLRGRITKAAELFLESGRRFSELGLFVGFSLLEIARRGGIERWWSSHRAATERLARVFDTKDVASPEEPIEEPFLFASANSPRQLVHLWSALTVQSELDESSHRLRNQLREMLSPLSEVPMGPTGVPLSGYVGLLSEISELSTNATALSPHSRATFLSLILRRGEQINAARADQYHWKMALNPADLVDLDLLVLGTTMVDRTGSTALLDRIVEDRNSLITVPLKAALLLRSTSIPWQQP